MESKKYSVEAISPINIALVKYWGKVDEQLIIPTNNSLSITVDKKNLCSRTKVTLVPHSGGGEPTVTLVLNEKPEPISKRILNVISEV